MSFELPQKCDPQEELKALIILPHEFFSIGGIQASCRRILLELSDKGWGGWVVYNASQKSDVNKFHSFCLIPIEQPMSAERMTMFDYFFKSFIRHLRLDIKRHSIVREIVKNNSLGTIWIYGPFGWMLGANPISIIRFRLASRTADARLVITFGGLDSTFHRRWLGRRLLSSEEQFQAMMADVVTVPDHHLIESFPKWMRNDVMWIPNYVDTNLFSPSDDPVIENSVLFVGRLTLEKGIDIFVRAIDILNTRGLRNFRPIIVGSGVEEDKVKEFLSQKGVKVDFKGGVAQELLPEIYRQASIFVNPMRIQGIGNTTLEAMACGKCIIRSKIGEDNRPIEDGENGLLFRDGDAEDLARVIEFALKNGDIRKRIGENARRLALERFSSAIEPKAIIEILTNGLRKEKRKDKQKPRWVNV